MEVKKSDGTFQEFDAEKIKHSICEAFNSVDEQCNEGIINSLIRNLFVYDKISSQEIRRQVEECLMSINKRVAKAYIQKYDEIDNHNKQLKKDEDFIKQYVNASNASTGSKYDSNANVESKNVVTLGQELHKGKNIQQNRYIMHNKIKSLYTKKLADQYIKDLESHIIYKHDESGTPGLPYCVAITMYPFLVDGLKKLGGQSTAPTDLKSYCGEFINLVYSVSSQFMGACATPEFLMYMDYFIRKDYGEDYLDKLGEKVELNRKGRNLEQVIENCFQQVVHSMNMPAGNRGYQTVFWNIGYFDKNYFKGVFGDFKFPDGTSPKWETLSWLQKKFMKWFNKERTKYILTFPVETMALLTDGHDVVDKEYADFTSEMWAEGHSFFCYLSDSPDSLSSCCFGEDVRIMYSTDSKHFEKCEKIGEAYRKHSNEIIEVLSHNPYTLERSWSKAKFVKASSKHLYKISLGRTNWTEMIVTHDHIFPIKRNDKIIDVKASELTETDELLVDKAQWNLEINDYLGISFIPIKSIEKIKEETDVYCLEMINKNSPYFVLSNGVITHNCRLRNSLKDTEDAEHNHTQHQFSMGTASVATGSKSVMTINLNRAVQEATRKYLSEYEHITIENGTQCNITKVQNKEMLYQYITNYLTEVTERVHKYQRAFNEIIKDFFNANMLDVYSAGFISLKKQYLTVGVNGLTDAAEYLTIEPNLNKDYEEFVNLILETINKSNKKDRTRECMYNTEFVPGENLSNKNYNWDKKDGYYVSPKHIMYSSYFFNPEDTSLSVLDKMKLHGNNFVKYLDGGQAAHLNLNEHLSFEQYRQLLKVASEYGCSYYTYNIKHSVCNDCFHIDKNTLEKCPKCGSTNIDYLTRIIGYLKRVSSFSEPRQKEEGMRYYNKD